MPPPVDLLIIGAGPVGLATAAAALHRGAERVLVVEQARALRPAGSFIDLLPNAYRVLCALAPGIREGLESFVRVTQPKKTRACSVSADGVALQQVEPADYGKTASLAWWQLQKTLYDALPDPGIVVLNHQLVDIQHEDEAGLVCAEFVADRQRKNKFKNWDRDDTDSGEPTEIPDAVTDSPYFESDHGRTSSFGVEYGPDVRRVRVRAKLVVGADGINSVARRCVYRDSGPGWEKYARALYSGFVVVAAKGSPEPHEHDEDVANLYLKNSEMASLTCKKEDISNDCLRVMLAHPGAGSMVPFTWYCGFHLAVTDDVYKHSSQEELMDLVSDRARTYGYSEKLIALSRRLWSSNYRDSFAARAYSVVPASHPPPYEPLSTSEHMDYPADFKRPWHCGRVVLVGDAIHAGPPFIAQGSAMGFEDVLDLVTLLTNRGIWSYMSKEGPTKEFLGEIFDEYRTSRLDRVCHAQKTAMNKISEYEVEDAAASRDRLWNYKRDLDEVYASVTKTEVKRM